MTTNSMPIPTGQMTPVSGPDWMRMSPEQRAWQDHTVSIAHLNALQETVALQRRALVEAELRHQQTIFYIQQNAAKTTSTLVWLLIGVPLLIVLLIFLLWFFGGIGIV